jgi:SAM-dependent methyltransferase
MNKVFDVYSTYYDLLYKDKEYEAEAEYIVSHIRQKMPDAKTILELGSGTGAHAEHLAKMGYIVHGIDMSQTMLDRAEARKSKLPAEIAARLTFSKGDVRSVRTGKTYDAVISLFHVMSYQTTDQDLDSAFDTAAVHLDQGGLFMFDYWYGPSVLSQLPETRAKHLEDDSVNITRIAEPTLYPNENVVDVNYTVFIEAKPSGDITKLTETHKMRYFFQPELIRLCESKNWKDYDSYSWMTNSIADVSNWAALSIMVRGS